MAELVEPLLIVRRALREQTVILHRRLLAIVRDDEVCRRLMTTPGVGPVVALTYRATVGVPARFRKSKAVGAVFGLTCSKYQSGEIDWSGKMQRDLAQASLDRSANQRVMITPALPSLSSCEKSSIPAIPRPGRHSRNQSSCRLKSTTTGSELSATRLLWQPSSQVAKAASTKFAVLPSSIVPSANQVSTTSRITKIVIKWL